MFRLGALEDLELVAALAKTVLGRIADAGGGKDAKSFLIGHGGKIIIGYRLLVNAALGFWLFA